MPPSVSLHVKAEERRRSKLGSVTKCSCLLRPEGTFYGHANALMQVIFESQNGLLTSLLAGLSGAWMESSSTAPDETVAFGEEEELSLDIPKGGLEIEKGIV